jgi:drug/metabolite transporter (DMT)-like permease
VAKADVAALLALGAAFFIAIGNVVHQRSAQQVTGAGLGNVALFTRLLRDRTWWFGTGIAAMGFALQASALGMGSVLLVQALLVTALLFALPINARVTGRPVSRSQWVWAVLLATAVAVVVTVGNPTPGRERGALDVWIGVGAVLGAVIALCVVGARLLAGRPAAAVLLAVVSGSLWGVFAVLTKGVVDRLGDGPAAVLGTPELYAWAAVGLAGTSWQQSSFRAGALSASLPTMTITEPLVASILGVLVLGETLRPGEDGWLALIAAIAVMVVAAAALARSEAPSGATAPRRTAAVDG